MARNLNGVTLTAPTGSITPSVSDTFDMTILPSFGGAGGITAYSLTWEWDQGTGTWATIGTSSSAGLYHAGTNPLTGLVVDTASTLVITAGAAGTFNIRGNGNAGSYLTSSVQVTVSGGSGSPYSLTVDSGSFTLTGTDATLLTDRTLSAESGTLSLAGQAVTLTYGAQPGTDYITGISFNWTTHNELAVGSDNWPMTWDTDGHQYAAWGDGGGFTGTQTTGRVGLGFARVEGTAASYTGHDVNGGLTPESGTSTLDTLSSAGKSYAVLSLDGNIYLFYGPGSNQTSWDRSRLVVSTDKGETWADVTDPDTSGVVEWTDATDGIGFPFFIQHGQNNGASDGYVYVGWLNKYQDTFGVQTPGELCLSRVLKANIERKGQYEWWDGTGWTTTIANREPILTDSYGLGPVSSCIYLPTLRIYLLITEHTNYASGEAAWWQATSPQGPYTLIERFTDWGVADGGIDATAFYWNISPKWLSNGDLNFVLVFTGLSGNDSWNTVEGSFSIAPITLAASTNIAASGEATTAQLTPPAGKTTADFVAGRIQDDENPADSVDITADDYTELEWSIQFSSAAVTSDVYEFRVTVDGVVLDTYTVTPTLTVGAGAQHYSLTAESGSFALTGADAALETGRSLAAENGEYTLAGTDAALLSGRAVTAESGAFTLTGSDVTLPRGYALTADSGAFTLTGQDVTLTYTPAGAYSLTAEAGAFTLAGTDAALLTARTLSAESGAYTLTGTDADLTHQTAGAYTMPANAGSFTLTGADAGLLAAHTMSAEAGEYTLTGQDAALLADRTMSADSGAYTLAGQDVSLTYTPAGAYILTADSGSFTLAGQTVAFLYSRIMAVESGAYTLTGTDAALLRGYPLSAEAGAFTLAGQDVAFALARVLAAANGSFTLTGHDIAFIWSGKPDPDTDPARIYAIDSDNRTMAVEAEIRLHPVEA